MLIELLSNYVYAIYINKKNFQQIIKKNILNYNINSFNEFLLSYFPCLK